MTLPKLSFFKRNKVSPDGNNKSFFGFLLVLLVIALLIAGAAYHKNYKSKLQPDSSKWQAVFLSNGQVYFGHLTDHRRNFVLTDIYYLQVPQNLQAEAANPSASINLVKLGDELHGPEDAMYIDHDKVMFWENLKSNSKVVEAINKLQP